MSASRFRRTALAPFDVVESALTLAWKNVASKTTVKSAKKTSR